MSSPQTVDFFATGGAVPLESLSYCLRIADEEIYASLLSGEFCYILTTRQIGKTSLTARTAQRLHNDGLDVAFLDLTEVGTDCTKEQWYYTLLSNVGADLGLGPELRTLWTSDAQVSPLQRWLNGLRTILQARPSKRLVIFIDEIDYVRKLPFETSEFFAAVRACYNRRTIDAEFRRLTFCLLGVATPSDLIDDVRVTPFNIGRRIDLVDFSSEEAASLVHGFQCDAILGRALLERVLYWTGGHPYLTQRLCHEIALRPETLTSVQVDRLCADLFLSPRAREQNANLTFVRDRLLKSDADLAELLCLYDRIYRGRTAQHNKADPLIDVLMLSGLIRSEQSTLVVRNRIYAHVFDRAWIRENMPDAELRRQRAAFRLGVLRSAAVASVALAIVGSLAFVAFTQAGRAKAEAARADQARSVADQERRRAETLLYAADMSVAQQAYQSGAYGRLAQLLEAHRPTSDDTIDRRDFEWRYLWQLMHRDRHTFLHRGNGIVSSVAFSPDGKTLASSNGGGTIELWDLVSWREVATLSGHKSDVISVAFSPDGRWLASASLDKTVKLWDVAAQRAAATLEGHKSPVYSVAFSRDGRWLASGDSDGEVKLWNVASNHEVASRRAHQSIIYSVAFSPDGGWLATGSADGTIKLWTAPSLNAIASFPKGKPILALAFSPDGKEVAVGRANGSAEIWNVATRCRTAVLTGHKAEVNGIAFSPNGQYLATGSWDDTVRLWDVAGRKPVGQPFIGHTNRVTSVAFSPDGRWLAAGGSDEVKVWDPWHREQNPRRQAAFRSQLRTFFFPGHSLMFSTANTLRQFVFNTKPNVVVLWDVIGRRALPPYPTPDHTDTATLSPDGTMLAIGTHDGKVIVRDAVSGRQTRLLRVDRSNSVQAEDNVADLAFSPDGRTLAAASGDPALVTVWDVASGREEVRFKHTNAAKGITFSPDGKMLAAANWQGRVYLWDLVTKALIDSWWAHAKPVNDVAFSPDGRTLATAGEDATVKLWNVATRREMVTLTGPRGSISSIAFSPDGNRLAALSNADRSGHQEAWIWEASSLADADAPSTRP